MPIASDYHQPAPGTFVWQAYDSSARVEFWSTALAVPGGLYFVDPIRLAELALAQLRQGRPPLGIILTNANHARAAADYSATLGIPIFGGTTECSIPELDFVGIDGAVADEIVVVQAETSTLIVGDALINFEPQGFAFLPKKYCLNQRQMRRSLRQLLHLEIERIFFAHGPPILTRAAEKLEELLAS